MKSKRNSRSIPLQLLCNRVYTQGGHEELKILLQICLVASRINQKSKNKVENTSVLKRILARKFGPFVAVVGAD